MKLQRNGRGLHSSRSISAIGGPSIIGRLHLRIRHICAVVTAHNFYPLAYCFSRRRCAEKEKQEFHKNSLLPILDAVD